MTVDLESVLFKYMFNKRVISFMTSVTTQRLDFLREQVEAGKIRSIVEKTFSLSQTADSHRYYEKGHLKGKVVITVV
ncbi:MAG: zinc-binding dehydrogenase [Candidatus Heimdallarchaeota archaeon]|nr:zinc-binding dehydrogenase [Candidatus Heimdallarchaeota archaeon]MCK4253417.1 zinc-binding dehydrogenase [Candidatus Heimdallarchaeota archaeon]